MQTSEAVRLGQLLKQQRLAAEMTLQKLAAAAGVSSSHLGRIERGERFPSGQILRRLARPLGFAEDELFTLAGYLSPRDAEISGETAGAADDDRVLHNLDPWVARTLAEEPVEVQRTVISILAVLKNISRGLKSEDAARRTGEPVR